MSRQQSGLQIYALIVYSMFVKIIYICQNKMVHNIYVFGIKKTIIKF